MPEHYFLYIIPTLPKKDENVKINLEESGWKDLGNNFPNIYFDRYTDYTDYNKIINYNNHKWSIIFRDYPFLNSIMLIIKCLDKIYNSDDFTDSDNIFYSIKSQCRIGPISEIKKYWLKFFESKTDLDQEIKRNNFKSLFSEIENENEIHQLNLKCFNLRIKYSKNLIEGIKSNIFTIISLSEVAHFTEHRLLQDSNNVNQVYAIRAFWGYKFLLQTGPGLKTFPIFFKNNLYIIDNILSYCQMDLVETQRDLQKSHNKLLENQTELIKTQNTSVESQTKLLNQIHIAETGILILTYFVMFDVFFTVISELIPVLPNLISFSANMRTNIETYNKLISFSFAFISVLFIYLGLKKAH